MSSGELVAYVDGSEFFTARTAVQGLTAAAAQGVPVDIEVLFNPDLQTWAVLGALLFLFVALGLGVRISSVSENQGQAIQLALISLPP